MTTTSTSQRHGDRGALRCDAASAVVARQSTGEPLQSATHLATDVRRILDEFVVTSARLGAARQRAAARRLEPLPLSQHARHLALFRLRELRRYDNEAQVDEEESANL